MPASALVPRHRRIADTLRADIRRGILPPGSLVPSYRSLMQTHSVTMATVRQAISSLQTEGLIESVPGVGCVVARPEPKWTLIGAAILGHSSHVFLSGELELLHDELAAQQCDLVIRFLPEMDEDSLADLASWARRRTGVMLLGRIPVRAARLAAATGAPTVLIGDPLDGECPPEVSMVTADAPGKTRLAVAQLVGLGHRRIGFLNGLASLYYDTLSRSFAESARELGLGEGCAELRLPRGRGGRAAEAYEWYAGLAPRPTALLVEGGTVATALIRHFLACGVRIPEDLSVMAISGGEKPPLILEGLACVQGDFHEMLQRAVKALSEIVGGGGKTVVRERLVARYVPGATCLPVRDRALTGRAVSAPSEAPSPVS